MAAKVDSKITEMEVNMIEHLLKSQNSSFILVDILAF
jgi:hypothetical protein